jgi:hypothetical protein
MKREVFGSGNPFVSLILDNEVTLGHFVRSPALPWARLIERDGTCHVAEGYPFLLTAEQARFEMRNWDQVSLQTITRTLKELDDSVDYVLIGNNAGQGRPLARSLSANLIGNRAAIIYAASLPEIKEYEQMGYRTFLQRNRAVSHLAEHHPAQRIQLSRSLTRGLSHRSPSRKVHYPAAVTH